MLKKFVKLVGGDPNQREINNYAQVAEEINQLEAEYEALSDEALRQKTDEFRVRIQEKIEGLEDYPDEEYRALQEALEEILPQALGSARRDPSSGLRHRT